MKMVENFEKGYKECVMYRVLKKKRDLATLKCGLSGPNRLANHKIHTVVILELENYLKI